MVLFEDEQEQNPNLFYDKLVEIKERKKELLNAMSNSKALDAIKNICDLIDKVMKKLP